MVMSQIDVLSVVIAIAAMAITVGLKVMWLLLELKTKILAALL